MEHLYKITKQVLWYEEEKQEKAEDKQEGKGKKATYAKNVGSGGQGKAKTGSRAARAALPTDSKRFARNWIVRGRIYPVPGRRAAMPPATVKSPPAARSRPRKSQIVPASSK